ncbi:MAG: hypothetical protein JOZ41_05995, partial [Chloroflexi bacterium]|nr:hypothetical protein [Chloroflexota bacterium]
PPGRPTGLPFQGFGFVPGERVTVRQDHAGPYGSGPSTGTVADGLGRFQAQIQVYLPAPCAGWNAVPGLIAEGDRGTSALAVLHSPGPPVACPAAPPGGVPSIPPPAPSPAQSGAGVQTASLRLLPAETRPDSLERAIVQGTARMRVALSVVYPGGRLKQATAQLSGAGRHAFRWRIPRSLPPGAALTTLTIEPTGPSLSGAFRIR